MGCIENVWVHGWMHGCMGEWTAKFWVHGRRYGGVRVWMIEWSGRWMYGIGGALDAYGWMHGCMHGCVGEWMDKLWYMDGWMVEWMYG